jgi:hypothetical protein
VKAVALYAAVSGQTSAGCVTLFPAGTPQPSPSSFCYAAGKPTGALVVVPVVNGTVNIINTGPKAAVQVTLEGWFTA